MLVDQNTFRRDEGAIERHVASWPQAQSTIADYYAQQANLHSYGNPRHLRDGVGLVDAVVLMPVDSASEPHSRLHHTLEQYAEQTMPRNNWELLLWLNRPSQSNDRNEIELSRVIFQFAQDITIRIYRRQYAFRPTMGQIRAELVDQALIHPGRPILAVCHDADADRISNNYLEDMTAAALAHPDIAMFSGDLEWSQEDPQSMADRIMQYWQRLLQLSRKEGVVPTSDCNTGVRLDKYAETSGFPRLSYEGSEMRALRQEVIKHIGREAVMHVKDLELTTSSRRAYAAIAAGHSPHNTFTAGQFSNPVILGGGADIGYEDNVRTSGVGASDIVLSDAQVDGIIVEMEDFYGEGLVLNGVTRELLYEMKRGLGLLPKT